MKKKLKRMLIIPFVSNALKGQLIIEVKFY